MQIIWSHSLAGAEPCPRNEQIAFPAMRSGWLLGMGQLVGQLCSPELCSLTIYGVRPTAASSRPDRSPAVSVTGHVTRTG